MELYLNLVKLYNDFLKTIMRADNEVPIVLDAGDTLVSLTLTSYLSYLMAGSNFNSFCYYQLPAPASSTKNSVNI